MLSYVDFETELSCMTGSMKQITWSACSIAESLVNRYQVPTSIATTALSVWYNIDTGSINCPARIRVRIQRFLALRAGKFDDSAVKSAVPHLLEQSFDSFEMLLLYAPIALTTPVNHTTPRRLAQALLRP